MATGGIERFELAQKVGRDLDDLAKADMKSAASYRTLLRRKGCEFCLEEAQNALTHNRPTQIVRNFHERYVTAAKREPNLAVCDKHFVETNVFVGLKFLDVITHVCFAVRVPSFVFDVWGRRWSRMESDGAWLIVNFGLESISPTSGRLDLFRTSLPVLGLVEGCDVARVKAFTVEKADFTSFYAAVSRYYENQSYSLIGRNCLDITSESITALNADLPMASIAITPKNWFDMLIGADLDATKYETRTAAAINLGSKLKPRLTPALS